MTEVIKGKFINLLLLCKGWEKTLLSLSLMFFEFNFQDLLRQLFYNVCMNIRITTHEERKCNYFFNSEGYFRWEHHKVLLTEYPFLRCRPSRVSNPARPEWQAVIPKMATSSSNPSLLELWKTFPLGACSGSFLSGKQFGTILSLEVVFMY